MKLCQLENFLVPSDLLVKLHILKDFGSEAEFSLHCSLLCMFFF